MAGRRRKLMPVATADAAEDRTGSPQRPSTDMVAKALSLLDLLGDYPHGAALSDLATRSGFPLSTTHRLLASLIRGGFAGTVLPQMEWLSQQTDEAVLMSVLDGDHQLYVHYVQGPQQVGVIGERGRHGPLHCTAMGKGLLAYAPREQSERLVETI